HLAARRYDPLDLDLGLEFGHDLDLAVVEVSPYCGGVIHGVVVRQGPLNVGYDVVRVGVLPLVFERYGAGISEELDDEFHGGRLLRLYVHYNTRACACKRDGCILPDNFSGNPDTSVRKTEIYSENFR